MEYQKIKILLNKINDQSSKRKIIELDEANGVPNEIYKTGKQIEFYTLEMKSILCDYCWSWGRSSSTIREERNKQIAFKIVHHSLFALFK